MNLHVKVLICAKLYRIFSDEFFEHWVKSCSLFLNLYRLLADECKKLTNDLCIVERREDTIRNCWGELLAIIQELENTQNSKNWWKNIFSIRVTKPLAKLEELKLWKRIDWNLLEKDLAVLLVFSVWQIKNQKTSNNWGNLQNVIYPKRE